LAVPHADTGPFARRPGRCGNYCGIPYGIPNGAGGIRSPTIRGVRRLHRTCQRPGNSSATGGFALHRILPRLAVTFVAVCPDRYGGGKGRLSGVVADPTRPDGGAHDWTAGRNRRVTQRRVPGRNDAIPNLPRILDGAHVVVTARPAAATAPPRAIRTDP